MEVFISILVLLALIGVSNVINRYVPFIPVPLIQIALGVVIVLLPSGIHLHLEPELFFLLFIAPLLYNDGKHTPRSELWRLRAPILLMAVGLVFVTVFLIGYAIHWMIPSIPLSVAFGLAAILSPTDAVAVSALAGRIHLPKSLMHLLEGEALMNDASGLVAFKFAVAAAVTGVFSLTQASISFLIIAVGGLVVGAILASLITALRHLLRRAGMEDDTMHMLLQLLTPFVLYLTAEELGLSGILAAVAGGVVHAVERDRTHTVTPKTNAVSVNTWSVILYILNGLVFVILGLQIPDVFSIILENPHYDNFQAFGYALVIFLMLIVLRFVWTFAFTRGGRAFAKNKSAETPGFKILAMTSLSGVRGAVTLAGAFSIPLVIESGAPFPERNLVIFLATVVILFSLLAASILLPMLARKTDTGGNVQEDMERDGQAKTMRAAIQAVHQASTEENEAAAASVIADYKRWMQQLRQKDASRRGRARSRKTETEWRLRALDLERDYVRSAKEEGRMSEEHAGHYLTLLDKIEEIIANRSQVWLIMVKSLLGWLKSPFSGKIDKPWDKLSEADRERLKNYKIEASRSVIAKLEQMRTEQNKEDVLDVLAHYHKIVARLSGMSLSLRLEDLPLDERKRELHWVAIQAERDEVQALYEHGEINREAANELRKTIREREALIFEQGELV
ncbi:Na+/H+ antiporter [Paenibacillus sp. MBLB4367]|uniref:Na+/H+ antiporter n=1 Tax=Paenibacillus sp. MBLB4367 TaxID=3384767 RepID=UPI0039080C26